MKTPQESDANIGSNRYEIHIQGHLDEQWADWFNGMTLIHHPAGYSRLVGEIPDKAALHGVLNTIRDLEFTLLSVNSGAVDIAAEGDQGS